MVHMLINQKFSLEELCDIEHIGEYNIPEYCIKGVVCYSDKQFMSFIKVDSQSKLSKWKLYNDEQITDVKKWEDVIHLMLQLKAKPTLIIYEQRKESDKPVGNDEDKLTETE